jgi:hypothetical protein
VLHVAASDGTVRDRQRIDKLRELTADVGAHWYEVAERSGGVNRPVCQETPDHSR